MVVAIVGDAWIRGVAVRTLSLLNRVVVPNLSLIDVGDPAAELPLVVVLDGCELIEPRQLHGGSAPISRGEHLEVTTSAGLTSLLAVEAQ